MSVCRNLQELDACVMVNDYNSCLSDTNQCRNFPFSCLRFSLCQGKHTPTTCKGSYLSLVCIFLQSGIKIYPDPKPTHRCFTVRPHQNIWWENSLSKISVPGSSRKREQTPCKKKRNRPLTQPFTSSANNSKKSTSCLSKQKSIDITVSKDLISIK